MTRPRRIQTSREELCMEECGGNFEWKSLQRLHISLSHSTWKEMIMNITDYNFIYVSIYKIEQNTKIDQ